MNGDECSKTFLSLCHHIVAGCGYHLGSLCIIPEDTSTTLFYQIHLRHAIMQLCSSNSVSSQLEVALGTDGGNAIFSTWPGRTVLFTDLKN
jgi:outer membrane lipopolysaccharide assembly protein LptE/RlpB